jgi:RecG-like helicase
MRNEEWYHYSAPEDWGFYNHYHQQQQNNQLEKSAMSEEIIIIGTVNEIETAQTIGEHKLVNVIITVGDRYPKTVCIQCWNNHIPHTQKLQIGDRVTFKVNVKSIPSNGYWNTQISAYDIRQM